MGIKSSYSALKSMKFNLLTYSLIISLLLGSTTSESKFKMKYTFSFRTFYNTFFITSDNGAVIITNWAIDQKEGYNDRLLQSKNLLAVRTESYGLIKGEINVLESENKKASFYKYDHIVEAGIKVESGSLQILECPSSAINLDIKVKPGIYRVRVYFSNMVGYDSDEDKEDDYYKIEVWPDSNMERKVLKRYSKL